MKHIATGLLAAALAVMPTVNGLAGAQSRAGAPPKPAYALSVETKDGATTVTLNAAGASVGEIAADLSKRARVPIVVGPSLASAPTFAVFSEMPLVRAAGFLAPRTEVDLEFHQGADPVPQGIYLLGSSDPEPPADHLVKGVAMGIVIEGNTEDPPTSSAPDPLSVTGDQARLSIRSRKQPLALVVRAVSEVIGAPVEIKGEAAELIDAEEIDRPAEEALPKLSKRIRYYLRFDLVRLEKRPLRIVVEPGAVK
jgi:hypothetical protein